MSRDCPLPLVGHTPSYMCVTPLPKKLELRAPQGATPVTLRMQALKLTAARFDDIQAHASFTGTGSKDSRLYSLWDQTQIWDPGD